MDNKNLICELKDVLEMIHRYNATHPEGAFIYNFVGFKEGNELCDECGEHPILEYDENKSIGGAFGHIEDIRHLLNMLRDIAEDVKEEDGHVDI